MQGFRSKFASHNLALSGQFATRAGERLIRALDWCKSNPACKGNLGIPRSRMPQITSTDVPDFLDWLRDKKGVRSRVGTEPVGYLSATQKEINPQKVEKMMSAPDSVLMKPVMVSRDGYLLDGHHRWAALLAKDPGLTIRTVRIDMPIRELLKVSHEFPKSFKAGIGEDAGKRKHAMTPDGLVMRHLATQQRLAHLRPKFASRFVDALVGTGMDRKAADELVLRTAGGLTDVSKLRFQAVFLMGAGGSGKGFAGHRWMKYMPGSPPAGYTRSQMEQKLDEADFTEQERSLSNLNFEKAVKRIKERYGLTVEIAEGGSAGKIPFKLYDYGPDGKQRQIPVKDWKQDLPPDVFKEVMGLTDVVFSTPKHELPSYWRQVNPDIYKEELAGYKATQPGFVHEMSSEMAKAYFEAALDTGDPLFVDGTGAKLNKMEAQIKAAKKAGYRVSVVMVWVPLTVNQIRNATRSRNVDPMIVTQQWKAITANFAALRSVADKSKAIDNRNDSADLSKWEQKHDFINDFIKRGTNGKFPDLYALIKKEAPREIAQYGKALLAHRAPGYEDKA